MIFVIWDMAGMAAKRSRSRQILSAFMFTDCIPGLPLDNAFLQDVVKVDDAEVFPFPYDQ
jgi:hypothetical protein